MPVSASAQSSAGNQGDIPFKARTPHITPTPHDLVEILSSRAARWPVTIQRRKGTMWTHCPGSRVAVPSLAFTLKAQSPPFGLATTFRLSSLCRTKLGKRQKGWQGCRLGILSSEHALETSGGLWSTVCRGLTPRLAEGQSICISNTSQSEAEDPASGPTRGDPLTSCDLSLPRALLFAPHRAKQIHLLSKH